jgi:hypothetical protein
MSSTFRSNVVIEGCLYKDYNVLPVILTIAGKLKMGSHKFKEDLVRIYEVVIKTTLY